MSASQGDLPPQQTTTKDTPAASSSVVTTSFGSSSYSYSPPHPTSTNSIGNGGGDGGGSGSGGDSNDVPVPKNASYFFGFLVTFVVLLLSFVGCGFGSRRARRGVAGRFHLDDDDGDGAATGARRGGRRRRKIGIGDKPVLWDAWVAEQKGAAELSWGVGGSVGPSAMMTPVIMPGGVGEQLGWFGIEKPISAMFIHLPDPSAPASLEKSVPPPTMTSAATAMTLSDRPSFWASYLHATVMRSHRHVHPTTTPAPPPPPAYRPDAGGSSSLAATPGAASDLRGARSGKAACEPEVSAAVPDSPPPPEEVQLSVMIAMPCPPHLRHPHPSSTAAYYGGGGDEERELGEYQLGVLHVSWDHEHEDEDEEATAFPEKR